MFHIFIGDFSCFEKRIFFRFRQQGNNKKQGIHPAFGIAFLVTKRFVVNKIEF